MVVARRLLRPGHARSASGPPLKMNKLLQRLYAALALAFGIYAFLLAVEFRHEGVPLHTSKTLFGAGIMVVLFVLARFCFGARLRLQFFLILFTFGLLELALQTAALFGVLPGVNSKPRYPYARAYWSAEGRGNSIRNRFGWYYPAFDLKASKRIAAIGDSMVEAVEVPPTKNSAYLLQERLKAVSPDYAVFGLGTHGTAPGHYLKVLEYAEERFHPQEAIIYISIGSDVTESSKVLNPQRASDYIYYNLDDHNQLVLDPECKPAVDRFVANLELSHEPIFYCLPRILNSYCMTLQTVISVRETLAMRRDRAAHLAALQTGANNPDDVAQAVIGFNSSSFAINQSPEVKRAMRVLEAELMEFKKVCDRDGIRLHFVVVPVFPPVFYRTQSGRDWTLRIGDYDYLGPERELTAFARENNIQLFGLGAYIQSQRLDVEQICGFYFSNGSGHFTVDGHRFCADAIFQAFYQGRQP
jgi:hypothetical protein